MELDRKKLDAEIAAACDAKIEASEVVGKGDFSPGRSRSPRRE